MMTFALLVAALPALSDAKAVRRDWATLSQEDKDTFARGMNILKDNGFYDLMVHHHLYAFETPTPWENRPCPVGTPEEECPEDEEPDIIVRNAESKGPAFLPFHRQLVYLVEKEMQKVLNDPEWGMPYWNYVNDAEGNNPDPKSNPMWGPNDIGSDGRPEDGVVADGPFAFWPIKWTADRPFGDTRPRETMLERTLGQVAEFPSVAGDLEAAYNQTVYDGDDFDASSSVGIRNWLAGSYSERGPLSLFDPSLPLCSLHCQAHGFIGASMLIGSSPNDPAFYLLHSFTDGTWYQWQDAVVAANPGTDYFDWYTPVNGGPARHNIDDLMGELEVTPRSVLDTRELDYVYEGLPPANVPRG
jgi:tyrosinase